MPQKYPCNKVSWLISILNLKAICVVIVAGFILFYGMPIIEAILAVLGSINSKDYCD